MMTRSKKRRMSLATQGLWTSPRSDLPAGLVVFLVALPLCLGIAQASSAPLLSGLIAGAVGGIVVSLISAAPLSVSGPAAGLAVLVAAGIGELGFRPFLLAVVIAGALQIFMGYARLGGIAHFFPSAVIKGMLAAIGILIVLKQLPHAVGYDHDFIGDMAFAQQDGDNTFTAIWRAAEAFSPAAVMISLLCVGVLLGWPRLQQRSATMKLIPPALVAVAVGGLVVTLLAASPETAVVAEHMVNLPRFGSVWDVLSAIVIPDFTRITDPAVWRLGVTLALVASLETLLCIEAVDRQDPRKRISPPNRELIAQGVGNMVSGLIGGLPITSVIVRSSANMQAGAQTRLSAITHGVLLLVGVLFLAPLLNRVPLAALAVVLIFVGLKLTTTTLWMEMWGGGMRQFVPFAATIATIIVTDLLIGTMIGFVVGLFFAIRRQQQNAVLVDSSDNHHLITFKKDMTFLQKARIKDVLREVPDGATVTIDRTASDYIDDDIQELLREFSTEAPTRDVQVHLRP